jgi:hypothetical protein
MHDLLNPTTRSRGAEAASPSLRPQPDPLISPDAPVTIDDIFRAFENRSGRMTKRGWQKRADREQWPRPAGQYAFNALALPGDVRAAVESHRKRETGRVARALVSPVPEWRRFPLEIEDFTDDEKKVGEQRRDFLIEVERMRINDGLTYESCCEKIDWRERQVARDHPKDMRYRELFIGGRRFASQLTFRNFVQWKQLWSEWRDGPFDTHNWHCLCPLPRFRLVRDDDGRLVRIERRTEDKFGDAKFWALFASFYESPLKRSRQWCYEKARAAAIEAGVPEALLPQLHQVGYFYREKADPVAFERAREGEKHFYDTLSVPVIRNWRKVQPNLCWSGDHHEFNFFGRVYDEAVGGWRKQRFWITDWIDVSSWYPVGWHISPAPNRDTIEIALARAFRFVKGVPRHLYFDNGKDYAATFTDGNRLGYDHIRASGICASLGVHPIYALPHNPRAKLNERNYRVMERFEWLWMSYCGRNAKHGNTLTDVKREDGYTLRQRCETYPKNHPLGGCLVRPELLPTLDEVRKAFEKWLMAERVHMISKGRVCPGQSPHERYHRPIEPAILRAVEENEIALAFLRVHPKLRPVKANGTFEWTPPGGIADTKLTFVDSALRRLARTKIQVRYDLNFYPPRVFAFEPVDVEGRDEPTWKLIQCSGPASSVPNLELADAIVEDEDSRQRLRDVLSVAKAGQRETRRIRDAEVERRVADQLARDTGLTPQAATYLLKPRAVLARTAQVKQADVELAAARKSTDPDLTRAYRGNEEVSP